MMSKFMLPRWLMNKPHLINRLAPIANAMAELDGWRKLGLKADDLINEENELVLKALQRLPPKEAYDRVYRIRRAFQLDLTKTILPREQWTKPEDDVPYLSPICEQIEQEEKEREELDNLVVIRKHH